MRSSLLVAVVLVAGCKPTESETPDAGARDSGVIDAGFDAGVVDAGAVDAGNPCSTFVITPPSSLNFWRGEPASRAFAPGDAQFEVTSGNLPPGMTVDELGVLSGTPTTAGLYEFKLYAANLRCSTSLSVVVSIDCPLITVTSPSNSSVSIGGLLTGHFTQTGAMSPTFFVSEGALPSWANLADDGTLTAEPDYKGSHTFRVTAQDFDGCTGQSAPYTLSAECPATRIFTRTVKPDGSQSIVNLWNSRNVRFQRGIDSPTALVLSGQYQGAFTIVDGGLPPGVSLDAGIISGAPLTLPPGEGRFVVRADFNGCSVEQELRPLWCEYVNLPASASWTPANYVIGDGSENLGWVNGTNAYHDLQKANFFDVSATDYTVINDVLVGFGAASSSINFQDVAVLIYDGDAGTPGDFINLDLLPMDRVQADLQNGALSGFFTSSSKVSRLLASKRFFVSVNLEPFDITGSSSTSNPRGTFTAVDVVRDAGGETLSVLSNTDGQTTPSTIWEQHADGGWARYGDGDSWNLNGSLMIFPNTCR